MSAFALKIIAMVTMFIDHLFASCIDPYGVDVWNISRHIVPGTGTTLYWIGRMIGRIAFPIFCFMLSEGMYRTENTKKYMLRLVAFAFISEIPFDLAFYGSIIYLDKQNVFFTLAIALFAMTTFRYLQDENHESLSYFVIPLCMAFAYFLKTDYSYKGVLCAFLFYISKDMTKSKKNIIYFLAKQCYNVL